MLSPVVVGDVVAKYDDRTGEPVRGDVAIYRGAENVVAVDLHTGEPVWVSDLVPLHRGESRAVNSPNSRRISYNRYFSVVDQGHYGLTVGGGMVYTICNFPEGSTRYPSGGFGGMNPNAKMPAQDSMLAALSLERQLGVAWHIGRDFGNDDLLRTCQYLSLPTYEAGGAGQFGRLYVVAMRTQSYYLLCLEAETGNLVWKAEISQSPPSNLRWMDQHLRIGTPPVVCDGRVFVTTNAGVLAAFDAECGQAIWAHQYNSQVSPSRGQSEMIQSRVNPLLVARGRLIALPADSPNVLALSLDDGAMLWEKFRGQEQYLTAIDDDRILLSSPSLRVLRVGDGADAYRDSSLQTVCGRPAVTTEHILVPVAEPYDGTVQFLSLKNFDDRRVARGLFETGLLGNLICAGGKLIASNALGLCVFSSYENAYSDLTERLEGESPVRKIEMLLKRAHLSFNAGATRDAPDLVRRALEDFQQCRVLAGGLEEEDVRGAMEAQIRPWLHRTHVRLGDLAARPAPTETTLEQYQKADVYAETVEEKAHLLIRLAKYYEAAGRFADAVAAAQALSDSYGAHKVVDLEIGAGADQLARIPEGRPRVPASSWSQDPQKGFIQRLIRRHGQEVYAAFDAQAREALDAAVAGGDGEAIADVNRRWPHNRWAGEACFRTAEAFYRQAACASEQKDVNVLMAKAYGRLRRVRAYAASPFRLSGMVGELAYLIASGQTRRANDMRDILGGGDQNAPVTFADWSGTLGEVVAGLSGGRLPGVNVTGEVLASLQLPLVPAYTIRDADALLLMNSSGRPVRLDGGVLSQWGQQTVALDAYANTPEGAVQLRALTRVDVRNLLQSNQLSQNAPCLMAGESRDGKICVAADCWRGSGFDIASGKLQWTVPISSLGMRQAVSVAVGENRAVFCDARGGVLALHAESGKIAWKAIQDGGGANGPPGPVLAGGGLVVIPNSNNRFLRVFDAEGGKLRFTRKGRYFVDAALSADGLLVLLVDGELTVHDPAGDIRSPLGGRRAYKANLYPSLSLISRDRVVVAPSYRGDEVEVLSLRDLKAEPLKLQCRKDARRADAWPVMMEIDQERLYVLASARQTNNRFRSRQKRGMTYGLVLCAFDLADGKRLWRKELDPNAQHAYRTFRLAFTQEHLVLMSCDLRPGASSCCRILDKESGEPVQAITLFPPKPATSLSLLRQQALGRIALANGRLILETPEGLVVYSER
jgi:outer membrane protein assembly factor BamB/tetratricopeptide (TPR) repeat protein